MQENINLIELKEKVQKGEVPVKLNDKIEVKANGKIILEGKEIGELKNLEDLSSTN